MLSTALTAITIMCVGLIVYGLIVEAIDNYKIKKYEEKSKSD